MYLEKKRPVTCTAKVISTSEFSITNKSERYISYKIDCLLASYKKYTRLATFSYR